MLQLHFYFLLSHSFQIIILQHCNLQCSCSFFTVTLPTFTLIVHHQISTHKSMLLQTSGYPRLSLYLYVETFIEQVICLKKAGNCSVQEFGALLYALFSYSSHGSCTFKQCGNWTSHHSSLVSVWSFFTMLACHLRTYV